MALDTINASVNEAFAMVEVIQADDAAMEQLTNAFESILQDGTASEHGECVEPLEFLPTDASKYESAYYHLCQKNGFEVIDRFALAGLVLQRLLSDHPDSPLAAMSSVEAQLITVERLFMSEEFPSDFHGRLSDCKLIGVPGSLFLVAEAYKSDVHPQ